MWGWKNLTSYHRMDNGQKWFEIAVSYPFNESNNITVNQIHPRRSVSLKEFLDEKIFSWGNVCAPI
jgi:hypothetical protein